ncbi:MAG: hypothetical protein GY804_11670 [Alphaproteobacteria bacterium]|nr:hypothetical protein [Alphaproteobacteria bacterium]
MTQPTKMISKHADDLRINTKILEYAIVNLGSQSSVNFSNDEMAKVINAFAEIDSIINLYDPAYSVDDNGVVSLQ